MMKNPVLEVSGLRTHFFTPNGVIKAVDGISFSIERGEVLGLVGESGSGKSMAAFSLLNLIDPPGKIVEGSIKFEGRELVGLSNAQMREIRGRRIAMIFQDPVMTLNPVMTIADQMILAVKAHSGATRQAARIKSIAALERVGIPNAARRIDQYPHQFSGGMRQRVAIAVALLHDPALILADEPTTALDVSIQAQILAEIRQLVQDLGIALIWISHDLAVVASISDRVAVMYGGKIVETGDVHEVLASPAHAYTRALLNAMPSRHSPGSELPLMSQTTNSEKDAAHRSLNGLEPLISIDVPSNVLRGKPTTGQSDARTPLLRVENVSKVYAAQPLLLSRIAVRAGIMKPEPAFRAVDDVTLTIARGETLGLVGESGSGKTTLGRMISGILAPSEGRILLEGSPVRSSARAARKATLRVQTVFQDPFSSLDPRLRIGDLLAEGPVAHGLTSRASSRAYIQRWLQLVGLDAQYRDRYPHELSGGQRQRVAIARALAMQPDLLVCDEPVASLDVSIQGQIINLFRKLKIELGLSMLFISHDLSVVRHLADRVAVMRRGRIVEIGDASSIYDKPKHEYTQNLLNSTLSIEDILDRKFTNRRESDVSYNAKHPNIAR